MTLIKICGITDRAALKAASDGASFAGFVFYPRSPRALRITDAVTLCGDAPPHLKRVGLFVDPEDGLLDGVMTAAPLDMIQLHGEETPTRVAAIAARTHLPVIKALRVATIGDVARAKDYEDVASWLLFDARPADAALPGGTGRTFDWGLLDGFASRIPWMLSGGLTADNIAAALGRLNPDAVDVSSGVEDSPGLKNPDRIRSFIAAVRNLSPA